MRELDTLELASDVARWRICLKTGFFSLNMRVVKIEYVTICLASVGFINMIMLLLHMLLSGLSSATKASAT